MVLTLLVIICLVGIFISCYALMTDKLNTKCFLDTFLISSIGIGWLVLLEEFMSKGAEKPIVSLILTSVLFVSYCASLRDKYLKDKEKKYVQSFR